MKILSSILLLCASFSVAATELENEKSQALLDDIRLDISQTLAQVKSLEGSNDWSVFLARPNAKMVRVGVILEPSSQLVLSVTANGVGKHLGLEPGDRVQKVLLNGDLYEGNFSQIELTHGDKLKVAVQRNDQEIQLETVVTSSFVPRWELYSKADEENVESGQSQLLDLRSEEALVLLNKLQERINLRLSDIYSLERKADKQELKFNLEQEKLNQTRLGLTIDQKANQVLSVSEGSNAENIGLKAGDIIESAQVNKGESVKAITNLQFSENDLLTFKIKRAGKMLELSSKVKAQKIPSWLLSVDSQEKYADGACGVVTFFFNPKVTRDIYNVDATRVDGDRVSSKKVNFTLEAGSHVFKLYDKIPINEIFPFIQRSRSFSRESKLLEIYVKPNKRYYVGAKFDRRKRFKTRNGEYWQPFVWKVDDYECSLD